jgi:hypothetical protein
MTMYSVIGTKPEMRVGPPILIRRARSAKAVLSALADYLGLVGLTKEDSWR